MLKFISLSIKNFLSYGNSPTTISLEQTGTTLILGEDLDNTANGHGANGVGKSVLINALVYGLYDKTISNISKDNLINNINKKNMEVTVTFEKDGTYYRVTRIRKGKGGNSVSMWRSQTSDFQNAEDITPDSISNTNSLVESIIGIPHELFVRIVVFSATHIPFLDLPVRHATAPSQTSIVEELFELTDLQKKSDVLKLYIKESEQNLTILQNQIETFEKEHTRHKNQVESSQQRLDSWYDTHSQTIENVKNKMKGINDIDFDHEQELLAQDEKNLALCTALSNEKTQLEKKICGFDDQIKTSKVHIETWKRDNQKSIRDIEIKLGKISGIDIENEQTLHLKLEQVESSLRELVPKKTTLQKEKKGHQDNHTKAAKEKHDLENHVCPYCKQHYEDAQSKVSDCDDTIKTCAIHIASINEDLLTITNEIDELSERKNFLRGQITVQNLDELLEIKDQSKTLEQKIDDLKNQTNPFVSAHLELEEKVLPEKKECQEQLQKVEEQLVEARAKLNDEKSFFKNVNELHKVKSQYTTLCEKLKTLEQEINPFIEPHEELLAIKLDKIDYQKINDLTKRIEHQKFLLKLLTKKDSFVRKNLLNKNIPFLNTRLQYYLSLLGLPHKVEFTHELTAKISQFSHELDFGNLSNGQRARVNIALSFAFRDVLQKLHLQINVCMLDEVLDVGLDTIGVQAAARMLKRKARDEGLSLYIISHRDEINSAFDNLMTIQMHNGFSSIKESA